MKRILALVLSLMSLLYAADGGFATPQEFGYPALSTEPPQYLIPADERVWHISGQPPLRATLQGISGKWGNRAFVILRTASGRTLKVAAYALSDDDIATVSDWLKKNNFEDFETYREGTTPVHVHSVIPLRHEYHVNLIMTDGSRYTLRTNAQPVNRDFAIKQPVNAFQVTDATLEMLRRHIGKKPTNKPELPIAVDPDEAMLYAATHDVGIAVFYLNRRGSAIDQAFRYYLAHKPEVVAMWAQHFVFLLVYCDDRGMYPPECHAGALTLSLTHSMSTHDGNLFNTNFDLAQIRNAWLTNTNSLGFIVYNHNNRSGSPYQQKFTTSSTVGGVGIDSMLRLRDDQFNLFGY